MAQEHRCITLSLQEALLALDAHRRACCGFLPSGEIVNLIATHDGDVAVVIKMVYGKSQQEIKIDFATADLLSALLQFCSENNVEVPSACKKVVTLDKNGLSLVLMCEI